MKIRLNVGGTIFETTKETLTVKSPYFEALLGSNFKNYFDENGRQIEEIFIDRDPIAFQYILNWLRDPNAKIPSKYGYELDFYSIDANTEIKKNWYGNLEGKLDKICDKFDDIIYVGKRLEETFDQYSGDIRSFEEKICDKLDRVSELQKETLECKHCDDYARGCGYCDNDCPISDCEHHSS